MKKSTKLTDRKKALHIACVLENEAHRGLTERQARSLVSHLFEKLGGGNLHEVTVKDFFERWLLRKKAEVSDGTLRKYRETMDHFLEFIGDGGRKRDLSSITAREIATFRDKLGCRLSVGTVNCALKIVRGAFAEAIRARVLSTNEALGVKGLAKSRAKSARRAFSIEELRRVLAVASDEWRAIILAGLYVCGPRLGDVVRWTEQQVDLTQGEIRFCTRKTGRDQVVPIADPLRAVLEALPKTGILGAPIFPIAAGVLARTKHGNAGSLSNQFHALLVAAGLTTARGHASTGKGRSERRAQSELSFHSLRHTATSLLKTAGVGGAIVQDLVGHDSAAMSAHYTHIDVEAKRVAVSKFPDITAALAA